MDSSNINIQTEISLIRNQSHQDSEMINNIKKNPSSKAQLKKVASEFEAIFITKMIETMDKTVDKENGIFGKEGHFLKNFKSFMYNEMGRQMAKNPNSSFGFAKQIYDQMEKFVPDNNNIDSYSSIKSSQESSQESSEHSSSSLSSFSLNKNFIDTYKKNNYNKEAENNNNNFLGVIKGVNIRG